MEKIMYTCQNSLELSTYFTQDCLKQSGSLTHSNLK